MYKLTPSIIRQFHTEQFCVWQNEALNIDIQMYHIYVGERKKDERKTMLHDVSKGEYKEFFWITKKIYS